MRRQVLKQIEHLLEDFKERCKSIFGGRIEETSEGVTCLLPRPLDVIVSSTQWGENLTVNVQSGLSILSGEAKYLFIECRHARNLDYAATPFEAGTLTFKTTTRRIKVKPTEKGLHIYL